MDRVSKRVWLWAFLAIYMVATLSVSAPAQAATVRHVATTESDTGDCSASPCKTISYAISQSVSGDTISIAAGTYPEHVKVGKSLALEGAGARSTVLDGSGSGAVMT